MCQVSHRVRQSTGTHKKFNQIKGGIQMNTKRTNFSVNETTRQLLMEDNKLIKTFFREFECGEGDEEDFAKLSQEIDMNRLGIPNELQCKIDEFIDLEIEPMVYEFETQFPFYKSLKRNENGCIEFDTEKEFYQMLAKVFEVLIKKEKAWDKFAERELKPYIV